MLDLTLCALFIYYSVTLNQYLPWPYTWLSRPLTRFYPFVLVINGINTQMRARWIVLPLFECIHWMYPSYIVVRWKLGGANTWSRIYCNHKGNSYNSTRVLWWLIQYSGKLMTKRQYSINKNNSWLNYLHQIDLNKFSSIKYLETVHSKQEEGLTTAYGIHAMLITSVFPQSHLFAEQFLT